MTRIFACFLLVAFSSCLKDKYEPQVSQTNFPKEIEGIMITRCAGSGCHNAADKSIAGNLDLSTWNAMFEGGLHGAVTIPYSPAFSTLLYYTNTDTTEGVVAYPTMPYAQSSLTKEEYYSLRDWIIRGAPSAENEIAYANDALRRKVYVSNRGCDNVAVLDASTGKVMRYIDVGNVAGTALPEKPSVISVTPDRSKWMLLFSGNNIVQIFDASNDELLHTIILDQGMWTSIAITEDSQKAFICNFTSGKVAMIDLASGTLMQSFNLYAAISCLALNAGGDTLYIGHNASSTLYKVPLSNPLYYQTVVLGTGGAILQPYDIKFTPDFQHYAVSCSGTNVHEVRIYRTSDNALQQIIPLNAVPSHLAVSANANLLFVTCSEDNYFTASKGSVRVIDLDTFTEIKKIEAGFQPYGITVDEAAGKVYVTNRNLPFVGGPSTFGSVCSGRNGTLSVISISQLENIPSLKTELSVEPFGIAIR